MANRVRVKPLAAPGHVRTPFYLRGRTGVIERELGVFGNPEQLAYGLPADRKTALPRPLHHGRDLGRRCRRSR